MIRTAWGYLNLVLATLFFGSLILIASLLRLKPPFYYWVGQQWSEALLWAAGCRVYAQGVKEVDWNKPNVVICNHIGSFDVLALAVSIPVPFYFVAKKELERIPVFGPAWKRAGHISIDRSDREAAIRQLQTAGSRIRNEGGAVVIFPEGTRSTTSQMRPFKKGAFMLAIEGGLTIIPAVITGSEKVFSAGFPSIRPQDIELFFLPALSPEGFTPETADELMAKVRGIMEEALAARPPTPNFMTG